MRNFNDAFSDPAYIQGFTLITTGVVKGIFYVESQNDIGFWRYLIDDIFPGDYEIKPAAQLKENGKRTLEPEYSKLHKKYLVGVDSDMDYLCPRRSAYSEELNRNPYVMHTFSYSKESLQCSIYSIEDIVSRLIFDDEIENEIADALLSFSHVIYEALLVHLFRHNKNPQSHNDGLFWDQLKLTDNANIISPKDLKVNNAVINSIQSRVTAFISTYQITQEELLEFRSFSDELSLKGFDKDNAYQFIKGHILHDTYVYPALVLHRNKHYNHEKGKIGRECRLPSKIGERQVRFGALDNFYNSRNVIDTMINNNLNYTRCSAYIKIQNKIRMLPR
ncbi:DUF4435 domain-containing protein [Pantoea stewartii]|uniref:DUF4435 domain-containing protein n=1 Tax=Pantoea stewartii TaxID=66269 RepID=UPI0019812B0F|nr:DUF4435 domain-containing protein [Pantoea stewartii]